MAHCVFGIIQAVSLQSAHVPIGRKVYFPPPQDGAGFAWLPHRRYNGAMTTYDPTRPLIVQPDRTLLLETQHARFAEARAAIAPFAELAKSPGFLHTYRITPLSLWSAAAAGLHVEYLITQVEAFSRYALPPNLADELRELAGRWGRLRLGGADGALSLSADDSVLLSELVARPEVAALLGAPIDANTYTVPTAYRGPLKQALLAAGWPVEDLAGYQEGEALPLALRSETTQVREYQRAAAEAFYVGGTARGGSGVVVLPPGAGKTLVGLVAMALIGQSTLVLTTNRTSVNQWRREILARTTAQPEQVAEYTGAHKGIAPITLSTYQMLTYRGDAGNALPHLRLFSARDWGLIIYDEVHALPAPVFRATAAIQARRRLGLTATLVREDGREADVFSLIGPKKYEAPWRELEAPGWIAAAHCVEVRVGLPQAERAAFARAEPREMYRIAAENPRKLPLLRTIMALHPGAPTLIIGQYLAQLQYIADNLAVPLVSGKMPQRERERLFAAFRQGDMPVLVISKVGNFALDLPDAELLIQVSGAFGSRQEEAQRLGRVLRPKPGGAASFYTLVTRDTPELEFAHNRQLFLAEQGYIYTILDAETLAQEE